MRYCTFLILMLALMSPLALAQSRILFVSDEGAQKNLLLLDPQADTEEYVTRNEDPDIRVFLNMQPAVSKDGKRVAYAAYRVGPDRGLREWKEWNGQPLFPSEEFYIYGYSYFPARNYYWSLLNFNWDIHVYDFQTEKDKRISTFHWDESKPAWTTRGGSVIYQLKAEKSVFVLDGKFSGKFKQITLRNNETKDFDISPDGRLMAYSSFRDHNWELLIVKIKELWPEETRDRLTRTSRVNEVRPLWSPDGSRILYLANRRRKDKYDLCLIDAESKEITPLTAVGSIGGDYSWSPDGSRVAYSYHKSGKGALFTIDVETGAKTKLTTAKSEDLNPTWSPDGKHIAFIRRRGPRFYLYSVPAEGGQPSRLSDTPCYPDPPAWFTADWME